MRGEAKLSHAEGTHFEEATSAARRATASSCGAAARAVGGGRWAVGLQKALILRSQRKPEARGKGEKGKGT